MKFILFTILFILSSAEPVKRRYLKGATDTCFDGEYQDIDTKGRKFCVKCSDNCAEKCLNHDQVTGGKKAGCQKCKQATFSDGVGGCDPCMLGCLECDNREVCKTCSSSAYMMEGNCYLKPVQCETAENGKGCTKCKPGYFLTNVTNGNCTTCGEGCEAGQCSQTTTEGCKKVKNEGGKSGGYYIMGGTAFKCDANCKVCYEKSKDQSVYSGENIPPGTPNGCISCKDGYFQFESAAGDLKYCKKCDIQCKTCSDVEYNCKSCNDGYDRFYAYRNSNGTDVYSCRPKDVKCKTRKGDKCETCETGYYVDASGFCVQVHPKLSNGNCGDDFAVVGGTCKPKSENCMEYDDKKLCKKCAPLTYLKDGYCIKCHENCIDCDAKGICLHCKPDYYSNGTEICYPDVKSTKAGANEKLWVIGTNVQPIRCVNDKYVDFANMTRQCKTCSQYCLEENIPQGQGENATVIKINYCDTAVGCLRCKEGFYVTPNGECSSCSPHCALCDQTLGCLHCLGDTVKVNGRCEYSSATSVLTLLILLILAFAI